ncbi:hypothetical protein FCE95_10055 [Luteimonas gilva]|uniref:Uncharacterized protein n=1 Tax=Luteimonas gilva TaxID=2572684 RepID=A0A4U5JMN4_9GAMM|nr:hypothetical protein [Luteimonas gilva]TKR30455.1 hypothetical protein FCE95_10055 [Luteimonas gilva]
MGYPISIFDTLGETYDFLREPTNIQASRQDAADALAADIGRLGSALEGIVRTARTYHRLAQDEGIWDEPGVASKYADAVGLRSGSYDACLTQAFVLFEMAVAEIRAGEDC